MTIRIERFDGANAFPAGDGTRYAFDFNLCSASNGWAQVDTTQDASYYGTWANPERRQIVNYCEGDVTITHCDTDKDFAQAVKECADWNKERGYWKGIDGMCDERIVARFTELGLGELLH